MSTRSSISMISLDGSVRQIYCHSDGYLSYNGVCLYTYYSSSELVDEMMKLGDASSIDKFLSPHSDTHHFDHREENISTFYKRDRKETDVDCLHFSNLNEFLSKGNFQGYDYVFKEKNQKWYLLEKNKFKVLKTLLKKIPHDKIYHHFRHDFIALEEYKSIVQHVDVQDTVSKTPLKL